MSAFQSLVRRLAGGLKGLALGDLSSFWRLSVRSKFLLMLLATSLLSLGTISYLAYQAGKKALTEAAVNQLASVRAAKKQQVEYYFRSMRESFQAVAEAPIVGQAIDQLGEGFRQLGRAPLPADRRAALEAYYIKTFLPALSKATGRNERIEDHLPASAAGVELQAIFAEWLGRTGENRPRRVALDTAYALAHDNYNRWFEDLAARLRYYDLFLADAQGNIVYSVMKETDLGQNADRGPLAGTALGRLVRDVTLTRKPGEVRLVDFSFYLPSLNAPSAFIATPVFKDGAFIGVLAGQISVEALSTFMHDGGKWREQGLGETGGVYLVGPDMHMRSDTREIVEYPDRYIEQIARSGAVPPSVAERIRKQKTTILHYPIRNQAVQNALLGRTGTDLIINRRGFGALFSYAPLDIADLKWVIVARMDENEILASQISFNRNVMIAACILALLATLASLWLARRFLEPVHALLGGISRLKAGERGVAVTTGARDEFGDLAKAFNDMSADLKRRDEVIEGKSRAYERLLRQIFPDAIADRMKQGEAPVAETFPSVTVVYAMIDGFPSVAEARDGEASIKLLNEIVDRFDTVAEANGVEKVKTVGEHYLAVSGLSVTRLDHARRALEFARHAWREVILVNQANGLELGLRIGIASGMTQAGLVGSRRFVYDVWGYAPSVARRIVYEADVNALRMNAEAYAQIADRSEIGEEMRIDTRTLGAIVTYQLRFKPAPQAKAAE